MEDASIAAALSDKKSFLFGVFDGHGGIFFAILGAEVSTFVERHFVKELEANKNFKKKSYELALK
jgi:serine/threonine protein phosphatase PrpC